MSASETIFCCPSILLTTLGNYRSPKECMLWYFARCMSDLISSPLNSPVSSNSSSASSPIPKGFLASILRESWCVIQLEKWVSGDKKETRLFIPHPTRDDAFLELESETVKRGGWRWGWTDIKLRCGHQWTMFVIKYLERVDWSEEERWRSRRLGGNWSV
jgi:hypothetical protein